MTSVVDRYLELVEEYTVNTEAGCLTTVAGVQPSQVITALRDYSLVSEAPVIDGFEWIAQEEGVAGRGRSAACIFGSSDDTLVWEPYGYALCSEPYLRQLAAIGTSAVSVYWNAALATGTLCTVSKNSVIRCDLDSGPGGVEDQALRVILAPVFAAGDVTIPVRALAAAELITGIALGKEALTRVASVVTFSEWPAESRGETSLLSAQEPELAQRLDSADDTSRYRATSDAAQMLIRKLGLGAEASIIQRLEQDWPRAPLAGPEYDEVLAVVARLRDAAPRGEDGRFIEGTIEYRRFRGAEAVSELLIKRRRRMRDMGWLRVREALQFDEWGELLRRVLKTLRD